MIYNRINEVNSSEKVKKMSLRSKITTSFILIIVLTLSPLLFILQTRVKNLRMKELEHQTTQLIDSKANEIGSWLNQRISEIRIIHENPSTKNLDFYELKPYVTQLNKVLRNQYGNPYETFAIGGIDGQGWINDEMTIDVSSREYFRRAMATKSEYVISNPVVSKSDSKLIFIICYPIINESNKKIGFINGSINLEKFSKIAGNIDIYNGFTWIMNKNKDIYSIDAGELKKKYISSDGLNIIINNFQENKSGTASLKNLSNNDSTVFFSSIPYTEDWILCTLVENSMIHAQTNSITNFVILIGVILLIVAIFLAIIISSSIGKPLQVLKHNMLEVSKGNLRSYYEIDNNDEVSVIGQVFNQMLNEIENLIEQVFQVQSQKRNAELRALQSQINPHFLYNTLDTLQWKALEYNAFEIADMINSLSRFFRISLSSGKEFITISDEIEHVRNYLEIQKIRYKDKINYNINVDFSIEENLVPKLLIQPLVENSIYHGLKPRKQPGIIDINVFAKENCIFIEVIDNGLGIDKKHLVEISKNLHESIESDHYGLYNVNERLKLAFSEKYSITIESELQVGTTVLLKIPMIGEGFECLG